MFTDSLIFWSTVRQINYLLQNIRWSTLDFIWELCLSDCTLLTYLSRTFHLVRKVPICLLRTFIKNCTDVLAKVVMENLTNLEHRDDAKENDEGEDLSKTMEYKLVVPIFILASFATFLLNLFIISSYPLIKNLSRVKTILSKAQLCRKEAGC